MSDQAEMRPPQGAAQRQVVFTGLLIAGISGFLTVVFFLAAVLTANPCGAFGDACDDYGTTSTTFSVMLALTFLAIVAFVAGLVLSIVGLTRRNRHTGRDELVDER